HAPRLCRRPRFRRWPWFRRSEGRPLLRGGRPARVRGARRRLPRSRRERLPSAFEGGRVGRQPRVAFVLGGGGVLGAHEVGMLRALREAGVAPVPTCTPTSLRVGRIERDLPPPRRPWEVGMVVFEIARRHRCFERWRTSPTARRPAAPALHAVGANRLLDQRTPGTRARVTSWDPWATRG